MKLSITGLHNNVKLNYNCLKSYKESSLFAKIIYSAVYFYWISKANLNIKKSFHRTKRKAQ